MRVTSGMMINSFNNSLENNLDGLNTCYDQISTERKFSCASDDPAAASKALQSLHSLSSLEQDKDSISEMTSWVQNTQSTVSVINSIVQSAKTTINAANSTGTEDSSSMQAYSYKLQSLQSELLETLNTTFNGRYVFGGPESGNAPFKVGGSSDGAYNGKLMIYDYTNKNYIGFTAVGSSNKSDVESTLPVDTGFGMQLSGGKTVKGTVFEGQTSPVDVLAYNMSATSCSDLYDTLGSAVAKLNSGSVPVLDDELTQASSALDSVLTVSVNLGEKSNMLNFLSEKNETDTLNVQTRLSALEDVNIAQAITNYNTRDMVYRASQSIGAKILQQNLIDFLK